MKAYQLHPFLSWVCLVLLFITCINGLGSQRLSFRDDTAGATVTNSTSYDGTGAVQLAQARKIVARAQEAMAKANKARVDNPRRNHYSLKPGSVSRRDDTVAAPSFTITDEISVAAALVAEADAAAEKRNGTLTTDYSFIDELGAESGGAAASERRDRDRDRARDRTRRDGAYWMESLQNLGTQPFGGDASYKVFRNVKDYGAKGDGLTDDTDAINKAISDGNRCGADCYGSSVKSAVVYFPSGTYLVSGSIIAYFHTNLIGNPVARPTIKAAASFVGLGVITTDVYYPEGGTGIDGNAREWYINTANFYRQIRNFNMDIRATPENAYVAALHYQVAQATSLSHVSFLSSENARTTQQAIFAENGSGGFMSDLLFVGGSFGIYGGSQQFTSMRLIFINVVTAVKLIWDWGWVWREITMIGCKTGFSLLSEDGVHHTGSFLVQDSSFSNVETAILTFPPVAEKGKGTTGITIDNCDFGSVRSIVKDSAGKSWLDGSVGTIDTYTLGPIFSKSGSGRYSLGDQSRTGRVDSLTKAGGKRPKKSFFSRVRPEYIGAKIVQMKSRAKGDGKTDDTVAFQQVIDENAGTGNVVFVDAGSYILTDTIHIPSGSRIVGQAWSQLVASGSRFQDESSPYPLVRVGKAGERGNVEIQDLLFTTRGPTAGLVAVEWNMEADAQGSAALWDCHVRIGGAKGSELDVPDCPVNKGVNNKCIAGAIMFHMTKSASAYIENMWLWVADHGLDDPDMTQLSVYVARGMLIESTKPVWLYGTASEHAVMYQYSFHNAKEVLAAMIQTESAYYQPNPEPPTPFDASVDVFKGDPDYSACVPGSGSRSGGGGGGGCDESYAVIVQGSSDITIAGAGLYSWFRDYVQTCVDYQNCQKELAYFQDNGKNVRLWNLVTIGATDMIVSEAAGATFRISALDWTNVNYHPYWSQISSFEAPEGDPSQDDDNGHLIYVPTTVWDSRGAGPSASCIPPCTLLLPPLPLGSTTTISWPDLTTTLLSSGAGGKIETVTTKIPIKPITTDQIEWSAVTIHPSDPATGSFSPLQSVAPPEFTVVLPPGMATFPPSHLVPYKSGRPLSTRPSSTLLPAFFPTAHPFTIQPQPTVYVTIDKTFTFPIRNPPITTTSDGTPTTIPPTSTTRKTTDAIIFYTRAQPRETCTSHCGKYDCKKTGCGKRCGKYGCDGGCGILGCGYGCTLFGCGNHCRPLVGCDPGSTCPLEVCGGPGCAGGACGDPDRSCNKQEAERCTHIISSTSTAPNAYSTTTKTRCGRYQACHATDTTTTKTQTGPEHDYPTATVSLFDQVIKRVPDALASQIASDIMLDQYNWNRERFSNRTTPPSGPQSCPNPKVPGLSGKKLCNKCKDSPGTTMDSKTMRGFISTFCNGFALCDGPGCQAARTIELNDTDHVVFGLSRQDQDGCSKRSGPIPVDYCIKAFQSIMSDCDDDSSKTYGGSFLDNSQYGCVKWVFAVYRDDPNSYMNMVTFWYHANCTGRDDLYYVDPKSDGFCFPTDCQVGSLMLSRNNCSSGSLQLSYWQTRNCSGDWYGYGYMKTGECRRLWTDGSKFKGLHIRCAEQKDDCVSKGQCTYSPEPAKNVC